ncbi:ATP-binding protein [Streptomyces sp. TG1A-60]|uniref:ATP-binding protein n=1 Tax=Streptomyces sp. TG1A-60 TaxID=3129111 RepID=UPI0030CD9EBA
MSDELVLRMEFCAGELPLVRALVEEGAIRGRLAAADRGVSVQAVLEAATSAVVHGGGAGSVELRVAEGELRCAVTDRGPGDPAARAEGPGLRLAASLIGGTGRLRLRNTRRGTTATLTVPLPDTATAASPRATTPTAR